MRGLYKFTAEMRLLRQLKQFIHAGDKAAALAVISALTDAVRGRELKYTVQARQLAVIEVMHLQTYRDTATRNKYKGLADLQEIGRELSNSKRCHVLIDNLIATRFYSTDSMKHIDAWQPTVYKDLITESIAV
jgi:hypothetical protein